jgi:PPK2 family polyphosphate:nucleotide phosphotransferase
MDEVVINIEDDRDVGFLSQSGDHLKNLEWSSAGFKAPLRSKLIHETIGQWIAKRNPEFQHIDAQLIERHSEFEGRIQIRVTGANINDEPFLPLLTQKFKALGNPIHGGEECQYRRGVSRVDALVRALHLQFMDFYAKFAVPPNTRVNLSEHDPEFTGKYKEKDDAKEELEETVSEISKLQTVLYAESRKALLVVFQAMDTGGKDGAIRCVFSGVNPQGCRVTAFKAPSHNELAHHFLWRIHSAVPPKGYIGIFNRSHYEEVLIVRVHNLVPREVWSKRYEQINEFEDVLAENNVAILKFYLHITKNEQKERLQARLKDPQKNWKFNPEDLNERKLWGHYTKAYEEALSRCSTEAAPWFIIPSNKKWFRNLAISKIILQRLAALKPKFPKPQMDLSGIVIR